MKSVKHGVIGYFMAVLLLLSPWAWAAENPRDMLQKAGDSLISRLVKEKAAYKKDPQILYDMVEENIEPYVDFEGFAKGVMGQFYRQATDSQRRRKSTTVSGIASRTSGRASRM